MLASRELKEFRILIRRSIPLTYVNNELLLVIATGPSYTRMATLRTTLLQMIHGNWRHSSFAHGLEGDEHHENKRCHYCIFRGGATDTLILDCWVNERTKMPTFTMIPRLLPFRALQVLRR